MEKPEVLALIPKLISKRLLKPPTVGDPTSAEGAELGLGTAPAGSPRSQFRLLLHCTNKNLIFVVLNINPEPFQHFQLGNEVT